MNGGVRVRFQDPSRFCGIAVSLLKRNHGSVEGGNNEREFYREIIRRAKEVRERAAESLRRSRQQRKRQEEQADAAEKRRRFRRRG
jgi:hypothetical protein